MHSRVVELHALPDPDGAGAQHHDFLPVGDFAFVFLFIARVEVRGFGRELPGAGVHHFEHRHNARLFSQFVQFLLAHAPLPGDPGIGEAVSLQFPQQVPVADSGRVLCFRFQGEDHHQVVDEEGIHPGFPHNALWITAVSQVLGNGEDPLVVAFVDPA